MVDAFAVYAVFHGLAGGGTASVSEVLSCRAPVGGFEILKSGHGGKRAGAGKPKGRRWPSTLDKVAARELVRAHVTEALRPLLEAQIANAIGLKYLVTRHKTSGKFIRVTEAMARVKLGKDEEIIEVWEKDPSVQAFTDLLNRALDKPMEQPQEVAVKGTLRISWAQT